ncbi:mitochondrial ribosomal protein subunit L20-domain-containing protein [Hypoxylon sp. NC1633]|nr:mitochondrial ribosomal protein subunit L20-domain-containing protein [Hypoxylon sp. NC1633]
MEIRALLSPLLRTLAKTPSSSATRAATACTTAYTQRRYRSTTSRTKKALKIAPDSSFRSSSEKPQVIFNPPSSSPNIYHTPFKFLPPTDPRRQANLEQLLPSSSSSPESLPPLPPTAFKPHEPKYNVTLEEVEQIRELRLQDPAQWTVTKLAKRFECDKYFIMMCVSAPDEHRALAATRLGNVKSHWGTIRAGARQERKKRKSLLLMDAL